MAREIVNSGGEGQPETAGADYRLRSCAECCLNDVPLLRLRLEERESRQAQGSFDWRPVLQDINEMLMDSACIMKLFPVKRPGTKRKRHPESGAFSSIWPKPD